VTRRGLLFSRPSAMKLAQPFALAAIVLSTLALSPSTSSAQSIKWGDVNGDGASGAVDAQAILSAVIGLPLPTGFTKANGDANCDGAIGAVDAQIVLSFVVGLDVTWYCVGIDIPTAFPLNWSIVPSGTTISLNDISGSSPSSVWAVGGDFVQIDKLTQTRIGVMIHFDGDSWSVSDAGAQPSFPGVQHIYYGVWAASSSNVWAVGGSGTVAHHDGTRWSVLPSITTRDLLSVRGTSDSDVWAGGEGGAFHFDGIGWSIPASTAGQLFSVWAAKFSDTWGVNRYGEIEHFDGTRWTTSYAVELYLFDIWGTSSSDVWAVGERGTIVHFDGTKWSQFASGTRRELMSIWGTSSSDVWAVGSRNTILHYDGARWSAVAVNAGIPIDDPTVGWNAIWGSSPTNLWVVGSAGTILHAFPRG
jgi:hypothetical protein